LEHGIETGEQQKYVVIKGAMQHAAELMLSNIST
jgi:hypothetical protein